LRLVVLSGPTAVGKTGLALELARRLGAEIVNADSLQVYRYLDIGTAKPTAAARAAVPHHLLDVVDPDENYDAARYLAAADAAVEAIVRRGRLPLVVGGTGLYIRALLFGLCPVPAVPAVVRRQVREQLAAAGPEVLHRQLQRLDPETASRLHPRDRSRLTRALEVRLATGRSLREFQEAHRFARPRYRFLHLFLAGDREQLYRRIEERVDAMLAAGFLDEVRSLLDHGYDPGLKPLQSIGYRQLVLHLQGRLSLAEARRLIIRDTRRYAKRQFTWFARERGVQVVPATEWQRLAAMVDDFWRRSLEAAAPTALPERV